MNIVITNPCFIGDILSGLAPIWALRERYPKAQITYIYEENMYRDPKEPDSILCMDPNINRVICLCQNSIPRAMDKENDYNKKWAEDLLGTKIDLYYDLHKHWKGSNGENWFRCCNLNFHEDYRGFKFYPDESTDSIGADFIGKIGISNRLECWESVAQYLRNRGEDVVIISENLGLTLMAIYCIIKNLKLMITPCCVHNTLTWATETPNILCYNIIPEISFDYQNKNTHILKPFCETKLIKTLDYFL